MSSSNEIPLSTVLTHLLSPSLQTLSQTLPRNSLLFTLYTLRSSTSGLFDETQVLEFKEGKVEIDVDWEINRLGKEVEYRSMIIEFLIGLLEVRLMTWTETDDVDFKNSNSVSPQPTRQKNTTSLIDLSILHAILPLSPHISLQNFQFLLQQSSEENGVIKLDDVEGDEEVGVESVRIFLGGVLEGIEGVMNWSKYEREY